jgi:hypothetical protein
MYNLNIGGVPEHFNLPWHLAIENGFFEKENISLHWHTCKGGTGQMTKMLSDGELDMAILLTEGACKHIIENQQFKIIQFYIKTPLVWGVHVGGNATIKSYADVFHHPIAISRFGSGSHLMPQVDAHFKEKVISGDQFNIIKNLDGALTSLKHQPDQVFYWEKFTTKPHVDNGSLMRVGEFITPWPCFVIVAKNEVLEHQKEAVSKVLEIINYTTQQFMASTDARQMLVNRYHMLPKDAHQWFYMTQWETEKRIQHQTLKNVVQILKDCGVINEICPISELVFDID